MRPGAISNHGIIGTGVWQEVDVKGLKLCAHPEGSHSVSHDMKLLLVDDMMWG